MTRRSSRRRGERGLTLIELLVTIALMAAGMVAMVGLFSTITLSVRTTNADAQITAQVRQVSDYVESEQFAYIQCASATGYDSALQTAIAQKLVTLPSGITAHVTALAQASSGTETVSGGSSAMPALWACGGGVSDYGVQQLQVQVSEQGHAVSRVVYKRWN